MAKDKKTTENKAIEGQLLEYNPLIGNQAITVNEENEQKIELIEEVQSLAKLNKQVLEAKQRETELIVDNRKLDAAKKLIEGINIVADKSLSEETIQKVMEKEDLTPQDLKYMAEAMDKMANTLKGLMRPSVQDEYGNRKKTKIMAQFRSPDGTTASIGVAMDDD